MHTAWTWWNLSVYTEGEIWNWRVKERRGVGRTCIIVYYVFITETLNGHRHGWLMKNRLFIKISYVPQSQPASTQALELESRTQFDTVYDITHLQSPHHLRTSGNRCVAWNWLRQESCNSNTCISQHVQRSFWAFMKIKAEAKAYTTLMSLSLCEEV